MTTYALTPQSTANATEWEFLALVSKTARELASNRIRNAYRNTVDYSDLEPSLAGVSLDGLRPEWLNNQAELTAITARTNYGSSQYATLVKEYECSLYSYALALVEIANESATN